MVQWRRCVYFAEYADLTSVIGGQGDPRTQKCHLWALYGIKMATDTGVVLLDIGQIRTRKIISVGGLLQRMDGIGWGATLRTGKLNEDGSGRR